MRRSSLFTVAIMALLSAFYCNTMTAHAAVQTYIVGDEFGWTNVIDMSVWPQGKTFHTADILVFIYDYQEYDVVAVDQQGHDTCAVTKGATTYESGDDHIPLVFGGNYFISSNPDNCQGGMKMAINATAPPPPFKFM